MSGSDIAQELIDAILDFLYDDRESLLSSSLVARNWVPATRYHIFDELTITHFWAGYQYRDTARSFLNICKSPYCTIMPSVTRVV
ncbi:hypothetical protein C8R47DRAFT_997696, partial [Mycena vitilis]